MNKFIKKERLNRMNTISHVYQKEIDAEINMTINDALHVIDF